MFYTVLALRPEQFGASETLLFAIIFDRLLPQPYRSGPKAPRAFLTTAAGRLVSDRDSHFARGTRCGRDCKPDSVNALLESASYVE
jgi:hypothetical protein